MSSFNACQSRDEKVRYTRLSIGSDHDLHENLLNLLRQVWQYEKKFLAKELTITCDKQDAKSFKLK